MTEEKVQGRMLSTDHFRVWVIEGHIEFTPGYPMWRTVSSHKVVGAKDYEDHPNRMKGFKHGQSWGDVVAFDDRDVALEAFDKFVHEHLQWYNLRLVEHQRVEAFTLVAGDGLTATDMERYTKAVQSAANAVEQFGDDELEEFARQAELRKPHTN